MKQFWNILVLAIFVNFLAAPTIALVFDVDLPQTNIVLTEEESHSFSVAVSEKTLPETLNVHDFLKFFETDSRKKAIFDGDDHFIKSPFHSVISPPPEA